MKWFLTLALVSILAVACAGAAPAYTPQPTVDVGATVDAAVEATRAVERRARATSEAQAEATRAAVPTETPVPTATPVSMTLLVPTPEPFVVAPGEVEESVDKLYDCLQEDAVFRDVFFSPNPPMGCVKAGQIGMREPTREKAWAPLGLM